MIRMDSVEHKLDANESIFFARELEVVESTLYEVRKKPLKFRQHIPVDNADDPGAETLTYEMFDQVGMAKIISDYADDLPTADVFATKQSVKVKSIGVGITYSSQELRAAALTGTPLAPKKTAAAKRASEEKLNSICWAGDSVNAIVGLLNNPNITEVAAAAGATSSNTVWSGKTTDEILYDIGVMVDTIRETTQGAFEGDTLLLPIAQYSIIAKKKYGTDSDKTILQHVLENSGYGINEIDWIPDLKNAFTSGTADGAFFFAKDPEVLEMKIPMELMPYPVQEKSLAYNIPMEARAAGVVVRYPIACMYFTGF